MQRTHLPVQVTALHLLPTAPPLPTTAPRPQTTALPRRITALPRQTTVRRAPTTAPNPQTTVPRALTIALPHPTTVPTLPTIPLRLMLRLHPQVPTIPRPQLQPTAPHLHTTALLLVACQAPTLRLQRHTVLEHTLQQEHHPRRAIHQLRGLVTINLLLVSMHTPMLPVLGIRLPLLVPGSTRRLRPNMFQVVSMSQSGTDQRTRRPHTGPQTILRCRASMIARNVVPGMDLY